MYQVLIIEDDPGICEILQFYLKKNNIYKTTFIDNCEDALPKIELIPYDIILLDIMLPGMDGISFCRLLRQKIYCPIIFISCLNDDETIIKALNMGGDDYLEKPFRAPVLMARIEANLRRSQMTHPEGIKKAKDLTLDMKTHNVTKNGTSIYLSPTEYELLYYLMHHKGRFISFEEIYTAVWQNPSLGDYRSLFVHITNLRKKIEDNPSDRNYIRTHQRDGYIFTDN